MDILSWISKKRKNRDPSDNLSDFDRRQEIEAAYSCRQRGVQTVPLERIVGSVGRYHDFDSQFKLKPHLPSERFEQVKKAMLEGKAMPPVKLYQIKEDFYVLDGNHRVAAARALGRTDVAAKIVELVPSKNSLENILYLERTEFQDQTGITDRIELTEIGQYENLTRQIEAHRAHLEKEKAEKVSFAHASRDWHETIYRPLIGIIEKAKLVESFPDRTAADLYNYIAYHQWVLGRTRKYGMGIDDLIPNDMEAFRAVMSEKSTSEYPEMQRWVTTFILMNVQARREKKVMEKIFALDEVKEIHSVHGSYDLIAKVVLSRDFLCSDAEIIGDFVQNKIRMINGVTSTQTLIPGTSKIKRP